MSGYLKAQRDRFDHHLFRSEKFCRGYAWDWLVANAAYKARQVDVGGKTITLERGQLCMSIRFIAAAWKWDKSAVSRFIERLRREGMIRTETETGQSVITICNYDEYQGEQKPPETAARQQRDSSETAARQTKGREEGKEGKKEEDTEADASGALPATPHIDETAEAVHGYNTAAEANGWPKVQKLTPARRKALKARLHEAGGIDGWRLAMSKASDSDFLSGRSPGGRNWRPNFDFFTKQASFTKLMEGSYDNRDHQPGQHRNPGRRSPHDSLMAGFAAAACGDGRGGF